jgi:hypothetical protein
MSIVEWVAGVVLIWALAPFAFLGIIVLAGHLSRPRPMARPQVVQPLDLDAARERRRRRRAAA